MSPLDLMNLAILMNRTQGSPDVKVALIDGPIAAAHPDLPSERFHYLANAAPSTCASGNSACLHGTFIAGILAAKRDSVAPAICPGCTFLLHPIFAQVATERDHAPSTTPGELATAIVECIQAGARVINLSLALAQPSVKAEQALQQAFDLAMQRGVIIVAAAGNQATLGSTAITRHPWVIPVVACDAQGRPLRESNLSRSTGRHGLSALGSNVISLATDGSSLTLGGTSVAAPFVTGTIALLLSEFPGASPAAVKQAVTRSALVARASVVPPVLDAAAALATLSFASDKRRIA
jgi:subtilisin family serine protease